MKAWYSITLLFPLLLGSCVHVYFSEAQKLGGSRLDEIPPELQGVWIDGNGGVRIDANGMDDLSIHTDVDLNIADTSYRRTNLNNSLRFYQSDGIYLFNYHDNAEWWEVSIIKLKRGNIYIYDCRDPKIYKRDKGLELVELSYNVPSSDEQIVVDSYSTEIPDSLELSHALFSGQMTRKSLRKIIRRKNIAVVLKSDGSIYDPNEVDNDEEVVEE